jgi:dihydrofolate reductase
MKATFIEGHFIEGHAVVSNDGFIADEKGEMFPHLHHPKDWAQFQARLDEAAIVVLGRKGHGKHESKGRNRLIVTKSVQKPVQEGANLFWNPTHMPFEKLKLKGLIAVTGGQSVFDLFLQIGYDAFILNHLPQVKLQVGLSLFSQPVDFQKYGLSLQNTHVLDEEKLLISQVWARL